jgi:aspartyl-tRNA synthetase
MDVYNRYSSIQIVIDNKNKFFSLAENLTKESVVAVTGKIVKRKNINKTIINGELEMILSDLVIFSKSDPLPFELNEAINSTEDTRLKYRYLDLRRVDLLNKMIFRSNFINDIRTFLHLNSFIEVETPILSKSTPEGARDYLVPTRKGANYFYALPQSPQIYKQLLMVGGFQKYFQIAKCFRDEDLRADRQPEFTQLDLEMSFTDEKKVMNLIEQMFVYCFNKNFKIQLKTPFQIMDYETAMNEYGSDKPDLRFGLKLNEGNKYFVKTKNNIFQNAIKNKQAIKYIIVDNVIFNKTQIESLRKYAKDNKAKDLIYLTYESKTIIDSPIKNSIEKSIIDQIFKTHKISKGTMFIIAGEYDVVNQSLGAVRNEIGTILNLKDPKKYMFV